MFRDKINENCTKQYQNPDGINTSIEYLMNTIKNSIHLTQIKNRKTVNYSPDSFSTSIQKNTKLEKFGKIPET